MLVWMDYAQELETEWKQCMDEGIDVSSYKELFTQIKQMEPSHQRMKMAGELFDLIASLPTQEGYAYEEPSDWEGIQSCLPKEQPALQNTLDKDALFDKIHGAWLGRICGCLLGKPIEGRRTSELLEMMRDSNNYPLSRYFSAGEFSDSFRKEKAEWFAREGYADQLGGAAPSDDDTNYTVLALKLIKRYGKDFTSDDVISMWLSDLPVIVTCTAERIAYRNALCGLTPPQTAEYKNPYREWIGAQIRGDLFGYINPADLKTAAHMAWRDARISHIKNGIYGEMFISAMLAAAAVCSDREEVVRAGLSQIPYKSRLAEQVRLVIDWYHEGISVDDATARVHELYNEYIEHDWCHTISNAMLVVIGILFGGGDLAKSICPIVQAGFDTDCNGATVGSIIGMMLGAGGIPEKWTAPFCDTLRTGVADYNLVKISELARETARLATEE